jgi:hypothetical protein
MPDPENYEMLIVTDIKIQGGIVLGTGLAVAAVGTTMLAIGTMIMLAVDLVLLRRAVVPTP